MAFLLLITGASASLHAATVCNVGFPGENSAHVLGLLPTAVAMCPHPAFVVLFVGMNDAVNDKQFLEPEQTFTAVTQILKDISALQSRSIVVTVHMPDVVRLMRRHAPKNYGDRSPAQRIQDTNTALRKAAEQQGAKVVDFNDVLAKAGGANEVLSTDGVHLTAKGYSLLAAAVASALPKDASTKTVLCLGDSLTYGIGVRAPDAPDKGSESYPQQLKRLLNNKQ
jgi:lysophospholipase L1-like esterase